MSILDTNVVDIVALDPSKGIARLIISDHLEWTNPVDEHLLLLQEKINRYLRFLEGGELEQHYPDAERCKCEIEIAMKFEPSSEALHFIGKAREIVQGAGFDLVYQVG
ncbi:DUF6572 domain-containing protein [Paraburkholderia caribensis]|uniref:Uncharacterized protein n=2 Tax=Paraburkholderia TaxID=1822464 RepID=B2JXD6_PARP8|nr:MULTISPECIES: DUF6572 domain-containing protein [Paraburkholderia]ACC76294.1 conserved hypothetical protein [Paraburkholderia phymatum STM815]MCO4882547.1 hypothetical protein [Paraburkholderia caribensis]PTB24097.1 hypothetical protein C9I56_35720 [Paraburkholderia caribensis]